MIEGIHHVGLRGPHPAAELAPYAAFFGTAVEPDGDRAWVRAPNGFLLAEPGAAPARTASVHATGLAHPCIQSGDEDAGRARLEAAGVQLLAAPVALGTGFRYCYARDAAGRLLEFEVAPFLEQETKPGWLTHVAFVSQDAPRLSAFYGALLGRKLSHGPRVRDNAGVDRIAQMSGLDVEPTWILGLNLMLEIWCYHAPALADPGEHQCAYTHLALQCADVEATQARALQLGASADMPHELWGQDHPAVRDPDGNRLVFVRPPQPSWTLELGLAAPDFVHRVLPARDAYLARRQAEKAAAAPQRKEGA